MENQHGKFLHIKTIYCAIFVECISVCSWQKYALTHIRIVLIMTLHKDMKMKRAPKRNKDLKLALLSDGNLHTNKTSQLIT